MGDRSNKLSAPVFVRARRKRDVRKEQYWAQRVAQTIAAMTEDEFGEIVETLQKWESE